MSRFLSYYLYYIYLKIYNQSNFTPCNTKKMTQARMQQNQGIMLQLVNYYMFDSVGTYTSFNRLDLHQEIENKSVTYCYMNLFRPKIRSFRLQRILMHARLVRNRTINPYIVCGICIQHQLQISRKVLNPERVGFTIVRDGNNPIIPIGIRRNRSLSGFSQENRCLFTYIVGLLMKSSHQTTKNTSTN